MVLIIIMAMNAWIPILGLSINIMMMMMTMVNGADPDPLVDIPTTAPETQFVLRDLLTNGAVTRDTGGIRAAVNITNLPLTM